MRTGFFGERIKGTKTGNCSKSWIKRKLGVYDLWIHGGSPSWFPFTYSQK
jgi:hypothetical protein